jgi:outer membrane protein assembly factor BamB
MTALVIGAGTGVPSAIAGPHVAAAHSAKSDPWPQGGFSGGGTNYNSHEHQLTASTTKHLVAKWPIIAGSQAGGGAVVGTRYYHSSVATIVVSNIANGNVERHFALGATGVTPGAPVVDGKRLVATDGSNLVAATLPKGKHAWTVKGHGTPALAATWSSVIFSGGTIYAVLTTTAVETGQPTNEVMAISAKSGHVLWKRDGIGGPLAAAGSTVYAVGPGATDIDHAVLALHAKSGTTKWSHTLTEQGAAGIAVTGKDVLVTGTTSGLATAADVYNLSAATGKTHWSYRAKGALSAMGTALVTDGRTVIYVSGQVHVIALKLASGKKLWQRPGTGGGAIGGGGVVYESEPSGSVTAYRIKGGHPLWTSPVVKAAPLLVADGRLMVLGSGDISVFGRR